MRLQSGFKGILQKQAHKPMQHKLPRYFVSLRRVHGVISLFGGSMGM